ncbi:MAG: hypothetical protein Tsb009_17340 [Planctomycetaceae bacterium]
MKTILAVALGLCVLGGSLGCQCCKWTERYADLVDDVSDRKPNLDRFYRPEWDLNRIGKPDWCRSKWNRWWCGEACCADSSCGHCSHCIHESQSVHEETTSQIEMENFQAEKSNIPTLELSENLSGEAQGDVKPEVSEMDSDRKPEQLQFYLPVPLESEAESKNNNRSK